MGERERKPKLSSETHCANRRSRVQSLGLSAKGSQVDDARKDELSKRLPRAAVSHSKHG